jgi:hypothetical protein
LGKTVSQLHDSALVAKVQVLRSQDMIKLVELQQLLKALENAGLTLVLLFDEFDTAAANPNFDLAFFGGLRNLSNYRLSYIVARALAWLDVKSIVKWVISDKGPEQVVDLMVKILKLVEP